MKYALLLFFIFPLSIPAKAVPFSNDSVPAHLEGLLMPDFKIQLPDSSYYYKENLPAKEYTIIMLFSPECDHCKRQITELLLNIDKFRNTQIVLATVLPFEKMKAFYDQFDIGSYRNIVMGRDVLFLFPRYFKGNYLPYTALYRQKEKLLTVYDGEVRIPTLIEQVQ